MKILHVTTSGKGGAGIAAARSHMALLKAGVDSSILFAFDAVSVPRAEELKLRFIRKLWRHVNYRYENWLRRKLPREDCGYRSVSRIPGFSISEINKRKPDLVNLHWINSGMMSVSEIKKINAPVVWTLHDLWPITGSAHCAGSLLSQWIAAGRPARFSDVDPTGFCRRAERDFLERKGSIPAAYIGISHWLTKIARNSPSSKNAIIEMIRNCVDLGIYKPLLDKRALRDELGLPNDKNIILFGAAAFTNKLKGYDLLADAIANMDTSVLEQSVAVTFGGNKELGMLGGIPCYSLGSVIGDDKISKIYQASDVFVCSSREDNYPNTVVEASACGIPTVAFSIGGLPDLVDDGISGVLVAPYDTKLLAGGIQRAIIGSVEMGKMARLKAESDNNEEAHATALCSLYKTLLS